MKKTESNEWVLRVDDKGKIVRVGLTFKAAFELGDVVVVKLPEVGQRIDTNEEIAILESLKAAVDIYAPLKGRIVAINEKLHSNPELITKQSYDEGWLYELELDNEDDYHLLKDH